ncbi:MAG: hypothetical protein LAO31_15225 [Acidobacteriia bacterium]|nr:hypothetical protein [Terriglobia bacterium]
MPLVFIAFLLLTTFPTEQQESQLPKALFHLEAMSEPTPPPPTAELRKRAKILLETAEVESKALQGGMRAFNLLQLGRVYQSSDKKKAVTLLNEAFSAAAIMVEPAENAEPQQATWDPRSSKGELEDEIVQALCNLAPDRAEELLTQMEPRYRANVVRMLLERDVEKKQYDRAIELVKRAAEGGEFPYGAADRLLSTLPKQMAMERQHLFATALLSFRDHPPESTAYSGTDFSDLMARHWHDLPLSMVRASLDLILHPPEVKLSSQDNGATMYIDGREVNFTSQHEYQLFQVLPILRQIDVSAFNAALEERKNLGAMLERYPDGMTSFFEQESPASESKGMHTPWVSPGGLMVTGDSRSDSFVITRNQGGRIEEFKFSEIYMHPEEAIAKAVQMSDQRARTSALEWIASSTLTVNPDATRTAIGKLLERPNLRPNEEAYLQQTAATLYLRLGDHEAALETVKKGAAVARKVYEIEMNGPDPNQALKAYWLSSHMWRGLIRLAAQLSPNVAVAMVDAIPDADIKATERIALASAWLGLPSVESTVIVKTKSWPFKPPSP